MRKHTKEFKSSISTFGRELDSKITVLGTELTLEKEDLFSITPITNSTLLKTVMKEVDFESKKQIGIGQEVNVKSGVKVNGEYEYIDYGNYSVYKSEYKAETDTYSHICYDKMLKTMIDYTPLDITYPINLREYINAIATKCGLEFADKNSTFANYNTSINEDHFSNGNYTFRDVLDYIAQLVGGWLCINDNDELEIRYPELARNYDKVSGENVSFTSNVEDEINTIIVDGKSTQATSTNPVSPSPDYPSEIESVGTYFSFDEETGKYGIEVKNTGKNLLENTGVSNTSNGVTFTVNDDKTILVNGNNDGTANSRFIINNYFLKAGTYILNGCPSGGSSTTYRLAIQKTSDWSILGLDTGSGSKQFTIDEATNIQVAIFIQKGQTISNLLFKPMIRLSSIIDDTYEPYQSSSSLFVLDQPLRSLPNGVKDELVIENGRAKIIKRIGKVVLDGSENWNNIQEATTSTDYYYAYTIVYDKLIGSKYTGISNNFIVKQGTYITASSTVDSDMLGVGGTGNGKIRMFIKKSRLTEMTTTELKTWLSTHNTQVDYELAKPQIIELGDSAIPYIDGINYMHISSNMDTTFSLVYPHKTISGNAYDYTEFNPPGVKQTGTIKSYNAITGIGTLMPQYPFMYTPMQGDSYAVISNIYNVSGFSYLYNTPYNTVNSLYTHGYTATWATPDGLCVLPDDFNITLQFSPDGNFFYDQNGVYQEVVNLITTETDDANNKGEFTIKIDKNKLIFVQNPDISLELPFYTNTTQVFVLSSASVAQINNDYVWDDTATWTDTYTWVEGGTSLERVCNHWWKVQITNTGIKIEEIFPTT